MTTFTSKELRLGNAAVNAALSHEQRILWFSWYSEIENRDSASMDMREAPRNVAEALLAALDVYLVFMCKILDIKSIPEDVISDIVNDYEVLLEMKNALSSSLSEDIDKSSLEYALAG